MSRKVLAYAQTEAKQKLWENLKSLFAAYVSSTGRENCRDHVWCISDEDSGSFHSDCYYDMDAVSLTDLAPADAEGTPCDGMLALNGLVRAIIKSLEGYCLHVGEPRESKVPFCDAEHRELVIRIDQAPDRLKVPQWIVVETESGIK